MKRAFLMISALCLLAALAGCQNNTSGESPGYTPASANATPTSTTAPDFGNTDFSGHWAVSEVYDSEGKPVTGAAFDALDTGFILELLTDGVYFVYDGSGGVLGQGTYAVTGDLLTLSAGGAQTVYTITDVNTLRATAADGSVTVMVRQPEEPQEEIAEPVEEEADTPEPAEEETDIPEEDTVPVETATPEPDADVTATASPEKP